MKKKLRNTLIIIITGLIITFGLIINNFLISTRIYYKINYKVDIQNSENIIEKSELFEYLKYCKYREYSGEVHNVSNSDDYYHIDRELIESFKLKIEDDKKRFHFLPFYRHKLFYSLEAANESLIYLTYNNNSIFKAEYANHTEIFEAFYIYNENNYLYWEGNWYLNFTQIPYASNISSTIILNDIILVKMSLEHIYPNGNRLYIKQFLCFNSNFQTIFVYFPLVRISVLI